MKKPLALVSLITGACLSVILVWTYAHTRAFRINPPQRIQVSASETAARPSQTEATPQRKPVPKSQEIIGYTSRKTPINAFIFGSGQKHVIVLGGIHGDEPSATVVADALLTSLDHDQVPSDMTVVVVPRLNPDGLAARTRTNGSGVDVNRNFPSKTWRAESKGSRYYPGRNPSSELEARVLIALMKKWSPVLLISIHAPLNCINWDGPAESIARAMAEASGYPLRENIGYETPGSLGSFAGKELNIPTITLELQDASGNEEVTKQGLLALRAALNRISLD